MVKKKFQETHGYTLLEFKEILKDYIENNPYTTIKDIKERFKVSQKVVYRIIRDIGWAPELAMTVKREKEKKPLAQCNRENHDIVLNYFPSVSDAKKITGISGINSCLNGSSTHSGGYFWRFLNEDEIPNYELNEDYLKPTETANKLDEKTKKKLRES